jgi:pseudouridylate synthase
MSIPNWLTVADDVRSALAAGGAVVALESTLIAHGLPWPINVETAMAAEATVREAGAVPATIAVWQGQPTVGLTRDQIESLGRLTGVVKASRRDLAAATALGQTAATTVAATMFLAHAAGIRIFATGGIGGAHRECEQTFDISADLYELARTPVLVVCAGAKSILDLPRTLEILETLGVPVIGYQTDRFPAFYVRDSGLPVSARADSAQTAAAIFAHHEYMSGGGALLAKPIDEEIAFSSEEMDAVIVRAEDDARVHGVRGPALTPYLLSRIADQTGGRSLRANQGLIVANAKLAGEVAAIIARPQFSHLRVVRDTVAFAAEHHHQKSDHDSHATDDERDRQIGAGHVGSGSRRAIAIRGEWLNDLDNAYSAAQKANHRKYQTCNFHWAPPMS